mgnify:CR=1 FL=1
MIWRSSFKVEKNEIKEDDKRNKKKDKSYKEVNEKDITYITTVRVEWEE